MHIFNYSFTFKPFIYNLKLREESMRLNHRNLFWHFLDLLLITWRKVRTFINNDFQVILFVIWALVFVQSQISIFLKILQVKLYHFMIVQVLVFVNSCIFLMNVFLRTVFYLKNVFIWRSWRKVLTIFPH